MDAYIISIIISLTPYEHLPYLRKALSGLIEDEAALFDVDICALNERNLRLYLLAGDELPTESVDKLYTHIVKNHIYIYIYIYRS